MARVPAGKDPHLMKFNCQNCGTRYTLSDEKVKNRILKIRCKVCEDVIIVRDPARAASRPPPLAPAPADEIEWYVSRDGAPPEGPMPLERIVDRIKSGKLLSADMVWNQSMTEWARAEVALDAQFKAARATVPRPPLPSPPKLPRLPGRVREPTPLLPKPRKAAAPLAPKRPEPPTPVDDAPSAERPVVEAPKAPSAPAASAPAPSMDAPRVESVPPQPAMEEQSVAPALPESAPPAPIASSAPPPAAADTDDSVDEPTQAMAAELGALFANLSVDQDEPARDTVALPASALPGSDAQTDTLFAPAATASAAAAMQANDTSLLPGIDAAPEPPSVTDWESLAETPEAPDKLRLSDAGPSLPSSEPPPVVPEPEDDDLAVAPVGIAGGVIAGGDIAAKASSITMTGEQFALAEGAFFGTDERPAVASGAAPESAAAVSAPAGSYADEDDEGRNKLPLLIVLGVLLLGGGIALGLMFAGDKGGVAPATTASSGSATSAAPETEAPASMAAATEAPESAPPSDAPPSTPATDAPSTAASVASAAPATKRPSRPVSVASRAKPKAAKTDAPASKAPTTSTGRFASLGSKKPKDVSVAALKTEAVAELPETLSSAKISGIIRRYKKGLHGCYQRQLKRDSTMRKANLKLAFNIERSGRTSNIKIDRKYDGTELKSCLNRLVRRWRFPQFTGEAIPVEYPLFFQASL